MCDEQQVLWPNTHRDVDISRRYIQQGGGKLRTSQQSPPLQGPESFSSRDMGKLKCCVCSPNTPSVRNHLPSNGCGNSVTEEVLARTHMSKPTRENPQNLPAHGDGDGDAVIFLFSPQRQLERASHFHPTPVCFPNGGRKRRDPMSIFRAQRAARADLTRRAGGVRESGVPKPLIRPRVKAERIGGEPPRPGEPAG